MSAPLVLVNDRAAGIASKAEYQRRYAEARRKAAAMDIATRRKLAQVYLVAADEAAKVIADTLDRDLSLLTVERWQVLRGKLKAAADALATGTESETRGLLSRAIPLFPEIDADFVWSATKLADAGRRITKDGLGRLVSATSDKVMASLASRLWADGQTFSDRVWGSNGVREDWLERIRLTVAAGIAQGRDPAKIARDIQVYTADGKVALVERWGKLVRGTPEFAKRLPRNLDWRATRLVRSELGASLQDASVLSGEANPGCDGLFDWVLQLGRLHYGCECPDLAAGGPYKRDEIPTYPHPQCGCWIRPHLREIAVFTADLKRWVRGGSVDYIDKWYTDTYKKAAA
jgi:hypothetical protein